MRTQQQPSPVPAAPGLFARFINFCQECFRFRGSERAPSHEDNNEPPVLSAGKHEGNNEPPVLSAGKVVEKGVLSFRRKEDGQYVEAVVLTKGDYLNVYRYEPGDPQANDARLMLSAIGSDGNRYGLEWVDGVPYIHCEQPPSKHPPMAQPANLIGLPHGVNNEPPVLSAKEVGKGPLSFLRSVDGRDVYVEAVVLEGCELLPMKERLVKAAVGSDGNTYPMMWKDGVPYASHWKPIATKYRDRYLMAPPPARVAQPADFVPHRGNNGNNELPISPERQGPKLR